MSEHMTLLGADDVARAGDNIRRAAQQMQQAADTIVEANQHFLQRFEELDARAFAADCLKIRPETTKDTGPCPECGYVRGTTPGCVTCETKGSSSPED